MWHYSIMILAGLGEKERSYLQHLNSSNRVVVGAEDLMGAFELSAVQANLSLSRLCKKGWLQRLRRGAYSVIPLHSNSSATVPENPQALAMELFKPCYVSGWSACEYWDLTEQIFNSIHVSTTQPVKKKRQEISSLVFELQHISPKEFEFGLEKYWHGSSQIVVSDLHRTIIDILDVPSIGGGASLVALMVKSYLSRPDKDLDKLLLYAEKIARGTVAKRLGYLVEAFSSPSAEWILKCQSLITKGLSSLDPEGPAKGEIIGRWNLRINARVEVET